METMTSTATQAITGTKLAVATAVALLAAGAAFAVTPVKYDYTGCVDSDSPNKTFDFAQLFIKSETKYNSGKKADTCYTFPTGKTYLMEGVCNGGKYQTWQKNCAELNLKKGDNFMCESGACINKNLITTSTAAATITIVPSSNTSGNVVIPSSESTLAKFMIVDSQTEGVIVKSIVFNVTGSMPVAYWKLYNDQSNQLLSQSQGVNGTITFSNLNSSISAGSYLNYRIVGDTIGGFTTSTQNSFLAISLLSADKVSAVGQSSGANAVFSTAQTFPINFPIMVSPY